MAGVDVRKLREAEEGMKELKNQAARLRQIASQQEGAESEELIKAANELETAASQLLKTIHEYRLTIQ